MYPEHALNHLREGLASFLRAYAQYSARHPEHIRIMVRESISGGERLAWIAETYAIKSHQKIEKLLQAAVRARVLPDQPITSLIYIIAGAAQTMAMFASEVQANHGVDAIYPSVMARHADAVIDSLLRPAGQRR